MRASARAPLGRPGLPGVLAGHPPVHSPALPGVRQPGAATLTGAGMRMRGLRIRDEGRRGGPRHRSLRGPPPGRHPCPEVRPSGVARPPAGRPAPRRGTRRDRRRRRRRARPAPLDAASPARLQPRRAARGAVGTPGHPRAQEDAAHAPAGGSAGSSPPPERGRRVRPGVALPADALRPRPAVRSATARGSRARTGGRRQHDRRHAGGVRPRPDRGGSPGSPGAYGSPSRVAIALATSAATSSTGRAASTTTQSRSSAWRR